MSKYCTRRLFLSVLSMGILCIAHRTARADAIDNFHTTDGSFTTPNEWFGRPSIQSSLFPAVGNAGGAVLSAEGSSSTLYLMYDFFNSPNLGTLDHVTIFFNSTEAGGSHTSYAVNIAMGLNHFQAFEKSAAVAAPVVNGGFDLSNSPWVPLSNADLTQANFHTGLGIGPSPTSSTPHLIAEFDLSTRTPSNPNGTYSPDPQFWSGSGSGDGNGGKPINTVFASEQFLLHKDGSLNTLTPIIDANGAPILQTVVPEPGSLSLLGIGVMGAAIGGMVRRRRQ